MISPSVENFNESLRSSAVARQARWPRRAGLLAALEASALATFVLELCLPAEVRSHAGNAAPLWFRILSLALPLSGGVIALVGSVLWVGARPERVASLRVCVQRGAPLLALWPVPVLLDRHAFAGQPLFLLLATGGVALGLEHCCRFAAASYRSWGALPRWRAFAASRTWPRLIAALAIGGAATFLIVGAVLLHARMMTSIYDLGLFENLFWNTLHGRQGIALGEHYFAEHAEFLPCTSARFNPAARATRSRTCPFTGERRTPLVSRHSEAWPRASPTLLR